MNQNRLLTAFFDTRSSAQNAVERLVQQGIARTDIQLIEGSQPNTATSANSSGSYEETGFWASLKELFVPEEERTTYAEGLRRGGYLVSLRVNEAQYERALDILDDEGTVNLDERSTAWRSEGWQGGQRAAGAAPLRAATSSDFSGVKNPTASSSRTSGEAIPIVEERLQVGKRDVSHGRVRVRSHVIETPVQEQVNLRQERVVVERRPVDRSLGATDRAFQERTIEATESAEEAVVSKKARVVEEVALKKTADTRRETVSDTVRKTQVDIEDERNRRGTGTVDPSGTKRPL